MVRGHQKDQWVHTTHLIVTLANVNRDRNAKPIQFDEIYPFTDRQRQQPQDATDDIETAKALWTQMTSRRGD